MERVNKKGIGYVRKREDTGKYIIDYYDNLGRRHKETVGSNYNDATTILREKLKEVLGVEDKSLPMEEKTLFKKYADGWIKNKVKIKEATKISYEDIIENHLKPYFGEASIQEIKRENIQNFVGSLIKKKLSSKSINNILLVLHQILDEAIIDKLIIEKPHKKIERPEIRRPDVDCLQTHEVRLFLNSCLDPKEDPQNYPLFYTAIFTGTRRGEFLGLQW